MHSHPSLVLLITTIFWALLLHAGPLSLLPSSPLSSTLPPTSPNPTISAPSKNANVLPRDRRERLDHPDFPYARCFCRLQKPPWKCYIYNIVNTPVGNGDPIVQRLETRLSQCSRHVRLAKSYSPPTRDSGLTPMAVFRLPLHVSRRCVETAVMKATDVRNGVGCIFSLGLENGHSTGQEPY